MKKKRENKHKNCHSAHCSVSKKQFAKQPKVYSARTINACIYNIRDIGVGVVSVNILYMHANAYVVFTCNLANNESKKKRKKKLILHITYICIFFLPFT